MSWGKKIRKYRPGERVTDIVVMVTLIRDGKYLIVNDRPYHPAVLRNWSLLQLESACRCGRSYAADLTPEWIAKTMRDAELDKPEFAEI